ncbi:MAG: hypothetical protein ACOX6H_01470 [Christensenellales bacterium]|jgi:hypothetical protein
MHYISDGEVIKNIRKYLEALTPETLKMICFTRFAKDGFYNIEFRKSRNPLKPILIVYRRIQRSNEETISSKVFSFAEDKKHHTDAERIQNGIIDYLCDVFGEDEVFNTMLYCKIYFNKDKKGPSILDWGK